MRFPDRPALNGLLAVVCALVVLGLLSWPGVVGPTHASPYFVKSSSPSESGSMVSSSSSLPNLSPSVTSSVASSSSPAVSQTVSALSTSVAGSSNSPIPTGNFSNGNGTASSSSSEVAAAANTTVVEQSTVTAVASTQFSGTTTVPQFTYPTTTSSPIYTVASQSVAAGQSAFRTLILLSLGSVVIAVCSMLFVYRRINQSDD